jgi:hypothetical protein
LDKYGRLGARKGWYYVTEGSEGVNLKGAHEFIDINGDRYFGCWSDTAFYMVTGSTLTEVTYTGNSTITTDGWDAATLNDAAFLVSREYPMIYFSPTTGQLTDVNLAAVNTNKFVPQPNTVISAYGRLWAADTNDNKTTVYFSDLLDGLIWDGGTAGSLDLSSVLVNGNDEIVALGAHAGRLIIFCKDHIVIYGSAGSATTLDPATMQLVEVISNVGCVARDSVQNTGSDIIFLSRTGVQSLGRLIQEKSQPFRDLSKNVRDDLVNSINNADPEGIRSVYAASEAFYLLLIPEYQRIYCFDMRTMLEDGASRVTVWDNQTHTNMIEKYDSVSKRYDLYFTNEDGMAEYGGYTDNGESYVMKYFTTYFDFGNSTNTKILKRLGATIIGASGQAFVLKAGFDYEDSYTSSPITLEALTNYEYGVAEYNIAEYTVGTLVDQVRSSMGGDGSVIQVGLEATIDNAPLSIQRLDIYVKQGRTL